MGFYWTGTGFEERMAPPMPPPAGSATTEPQLKAPVDGAIELTSSWPPAANALQTERDEVSQKAAQALEKHFSYQSEVRNAENRKKSDDAGPMSFDPVQGIWMRADKNTALFPTPPAPPAGIADTSSRGKEPSDTGSFFKWTSWFRTDAEKGRALRISTPHAESEANLEPVATCEDASEIHSTPAVQDIAAPEVHSDLAGDNVSLLAVPISNIQEIAANEAEITASDESALVTAASLADIQDTDAPEAQSESNENIVVPAPSWEPETHPGGTMWQTATNGREAVSKAPRSAEGTSRDANPSRWFVLKGMLRDAPAPETLEPAGAVPVLEVFSLAGGVGKTSLVATLGRALSARGERVLLVEATSLPSMQYFFGACDTRPGALRTFRPPVSSSDAPIRLATVDTEAHTMDSATQDSLATDIQRWAQGTSRVIVDVGTGSTATVRELSKTSPAILVPLVPDVNSVVTASAIDSFFQRQGGASGIQSTVFYVLNQFDSSLPLHLDVRGMLQERLGDRLLPFTLEHSPAVNEALAEGMTVIDYAPDAQITANFTNLAKWLETVLAPAKSNSSGRWSER